MSAIPKRMTTMELFQDVPLSFYCDVEAEYCPPFKGDNEQPEERGGWCVNAVYRTDNAGVRRDISHLVSAEEWEKLDEFVNRMWG